MIVLCFWVQIVQSVHTQAMYLWFDWILKLWQWNQFWLWKF